MKNNWNRQKREFEKLSLNIYKKRSKHGNRQIRTKSRENVVLNAIFVTIVKKSNISIDNGEIICYTVIPPKKAGITEESRAEKDFKKSLKKVLTRQRKCGRIVKLSERGQ